MSLPCLDILGVKISVVNIHSARDIINDWIKTFHKTYVCVVPVSTVVACVENKEYLDIVNQAGMATPDGMPLVWLGKLTGHKAIGRTYGADLMLAMCDSGQHQGYRHYFYGGDPLMKERFLGNLKKEFPAIKIVGDFSPSLRAVGQLEEASVIEGINTVNPDILWVGLGSPKQDYWMHQHRNKLNVPVMLGVGAAFDFIAGIKPQAPRWMQRSGLEWFFRFCCEPKRLWKRYLIGNSKFIWYLLRSSLGKRCDKI